MSNEAAVMSKSEILESLVTLKANAKHMRSSSVAFRKWEVTAGRTDGVKLAPQAISIIEILVRKHLGKEITEKMVEELVSAPDVLKTRQDPVRIWQYYRKAIQEAGWIKPINVEAAK
jgi:hypothetical protein